MRTLHRLPIAILLLTLAVAASGCSGGTPTTSASAVQEPAHSESFLPGAGDAFPQENNTAADSGSAARGGGVTFGSGN